MSHLRPDKRIEAGDKGNASRPGLSWIRVEKSDGIAGVDLGQAQRAWQDDVVSPCGRSRIIGRFRSHATAGKLGGNSAEPVNFSTGRVSDQTLRLYWYPASESMVSDYRTARRR